jgi:WD40 repeat protein
VSNMHRLDEKIESSGFKIEHYLYLCKDVVGSVGWHPKDNCIASCTTDSGYFHTFDIRINENKPAYIYDSLKSELYTHCYMNEESVILGFGDGATQIYDIRMGKVLISFVDPYQKYIGDLSFQNNICSVFGSEVTFWKYTGSDIEILAHHTHSKAKGHKTSGCYIPNTNIVATTDSIGIFSMYETNKF